MINIIGLDVIVKTPISEHFGRVIAYNGSNKISLNTRAGEDDTGDTTKTIIIQSDTIVIDTIQD